MEHTTKQGQNYNTRGQRQRYLKVAASGRRLATITAFASKAELQPPRSAISFYFEVRRVKSGEVLSFHIISMSRKDTFILKHMVRLACAPAPLTSMLPLSAVARWSAALRRDAGRIDSSITPVCDADRAVPVGNHSPAAVRRCSPHLKGS